MRDVRGFDRVALAVVTHRHHDHPGGMDEGIRDLTVDRFLGVTEDCPTARYGPSRFPTDGSWREGTA
jgi:hypothetical protein